jgi:8-oxo-dGTP diphosphatase
MPANIEEYKNPAATATLIVQDDYKILLIQRKHEPFKGKWALPGGFLDCDKESLEEAAVRELEEETNLKSNVKDISLLLVNSQPDRDPRGHVIDHVYIVHKYEGIAKAKDDAESLDWFSFYNLPELAFDHIKAIKAYIAKGYAHIDTK